MRVTHFGSPDINFPEAQCKYTDPEIFFPHIYNGRERISQANKTAIEICGTCVHEVDCAAYAIVEPELYGIWGGTTHKDRNKLRRKYGITGLRNSVSDVDDVTNG
jgi:WhiB family redox-sensing transcriptional regulator